ncbi:hypothetical protein PV04_10782 [Phialophora macrospora]|uniref:Uncharacterized protein n=1 Tax=Phialophora macrospora TaxID=1851006 RepID=A0A0D2FRJ6_9EURO|nr:hypothetical protein PV04_10782 [Phialophora macrospora]
MVAGSSREVGGHLAFEYKVVSKVLSIVSLPPSDSLTRTPLQQPNTSKAFRFNQKPLVSFSHSTTKTPLRLYPTTINMKFFTAAAALIAGASAAAVKRGDAGNTWGDWGASTVYSTIYTTEYSTEYSTVYSTVPTTVYATAYSTIYKTETVPTTVYQTETVPTTVYKTETVPTTVYSTATVTTTAVQEWTDWSVSTAYVTVPVTYTATVPEYVTVTAAATWGDWN